MFTNIILARVCVWIFCGQKLGQHQIWKIFYYLSDCHEASRMCSQTSSLVWARASTFCSQKLGQHRIWQIFYFLSNCHKASHTCSQASSLVRVRISTFCSQKRGQNRIWHFLLYFLSDCHGTSHVFTNIIACMSSRFDLLQSKNRSAWNLEFNRFDRFYIYPIVTKLHTRVHKHHLLYEFAFWPSAVKN